MERKKPLDAAGLRMAALFCMLLDHLWYTVLPGAEWMHGLGRLAFPIFAFQAAEGYARTGNLRRYLLRLGVLGLASEIPFNLMASGTVLDPARQNVIWTLLLGVLALRAAEQGRGWALAAAALAALAGELLHADYGAVGVLTVCCFGLLRDSRSGQLAAMLALHGVLFWGSVQALAVLALVPIWLYNGRPGSRWVRTVSYWFYPLHMLALWALKLTL